MQLNFLPLSTFDSAHMRKIPGSPHLHNFNVHVPECGSLGTRGYSAELALHQYISLSDIASSTVHVYAWHSQAS